MNNENQPGNIMSIIMGSFSMISFFVLTIEGLSTGKFLPVGIALSNSANFLELGGFTIESRPDCASTGSGRLSVT